MRRALLAGVLTGLATASLGCPPPSQMRVGLVDGSRVVRISQRGQKIRKQIEEEGDRLTTKLEALQKRLATLAAEHKSLAAKLPPTDPKVLAAETARLKLEKELRETHLQYRKQLNEFGERLLGDFKEAVRRVAMRIRADRGLDLVLMTSRGEEQGLWVWPVSDITDEVVRRMDDEH